MSKYGLFNPNQKPSLITISSNTEQEVARYMLDRALEQDHVGDGVETIKEYLDGWAEVLTENDPDNDYTFDEITDVVADNLVYCNAPHIINLKTSTEVSNQFRQDVCTEIVRLLDQGIEK